MSEEISEVKTIFWMDNVNAPKLDSGYSIMVERSFPPGGRYYWVVEHKEGSFESIARFNKKEYAVDYVWLKERPTGKVQKTMSVNTRAKELIKNIDEHLNAAVKDANELLDDGTWGHDDDTVDFIYRTEKLIAKLRELKRKWDGS